MNDQHEPALPTADGLTFRPLAPADLQAWLALIERIAGAEGAHWHETRSDLLEVFGSTVNDAASNTVVGMDAGGVPRAFGRVEKNDGGDVAYAFGGVDPEWQRRGIGSVVLRWQEERIRRRFAAEGLAPRVRTYTAEDNAAPRDLLAGAGFEVVRYFNEMLRPLAELPEVPDPRGVVIAPFTPALGPAVRLAHNEAFADHWGNEPRTVEQWAFLLDHELFRPDWSAVALDAETGEVAGYQMAMHDPERFEKEGRLEGYTEILGVRRPWRRRGVAPALLADAMARFKSSGMGYACLDVDTENPTGALRLYEEMGYSPLRRTLAWDKPL
jgi:mycothiol synthase